MKTLFGIRSHVAIVVVGSLYLIISLHISIHELEHFNQYHSEYDDTNEYLLVDTNTDSFHIISLILSLSCLLSSILLILGVLEKRYEIIRPWLVFNFLLECVFVCIFFYLLLFVADVYKSSWLNTCGLLVLIFFVSMVTVFHTYLWNGIYSLYKDCQNNYLRLYRVPDGEDTVAVHTV